MFHQTSTRDQATLAYYFHDGIPIYIWLRNRIDRQILEFPNLVVAYYLNLPLLHFPLDLAKLAGT